MRRSYSQHSGMLSTFGKECSGFPDIGDWWGAWGSWREKQPLMRRGAQQGH